MSDLRDEQQDRRRLRKGPVIAVLSVAVVVLLALSGVLGAQLLFADDEEPAAGGETTSSAPPSSKPVIREDLKVSVGEGGSATSEHDPSVPVGYEPTCKGAVEAATNYLVGLDYTKATSGEMSQDDYIALTRELTTGDHQTSAIETAQDAFEQMGDVDSPRGSIRPDWGGFTLAECTEGESASVQIVYAYDYWGEGEFYYSATTTNLTWADGDWKINGTGKAEAPTTLPEEPVTEPDDEVSTLVGTHTQWENYEDAG
jgi:hypothetical protein